MKPCGDPLRTVDVRLSRFDFLNPATGQPLPVPTHYKDGVGSHFDPSFGAPRTMLNPRQFQFAAKLVF